MVLLTNERDDVEQLAHAEKGKIGTLLKEENSLVALLLSKTSHKTLTVGAGLNVMEAWENQTSA